MVLSYNLPAMFRSFVHVFELCISICFVLIEEGFLLETYNSVLMDTNCGDISAIAF